MDLAAEWKWWSDWDRLLEVALSAVLFYVLIVALVRVMGKRTTAQLNNFDWIINVAVGSLAASGMLLEDIATLDAAAAILALTVCQYLLTRLVRVSPAISRMVRAEPTLLYHKGRFIEPALRRTRIAESEVTAALRHHGVAETSSADWVVLETDGELSVITGSSLDIAEADTMHDVEKPGTADSRPKRGSTPR